MENSEQPAFSRSVCESSERIYDNGAVGLTKREYFAVNAPDPPSWFEYKSKLKKPPQPKSWETIDYAPHKEECKNWQHDPSYNLPEELNWYQAAWEKHWEEIEAYKIAKRSEFYFVWRSHFADALLKQLKS